MCRRVSGSKVATTACVCEGLSPAALHLLSTCSSAAVRSAPCSPSEGLDALPLSIWSMEHWDMETWLHRICTTGTGSGTWKGHSHALSGRRWLLRYADGTLTHLVEQLLLLLLLVALRVVDKADLFHAVLLVRRKAGMRTVRR